MVVRTPVFLRFLGRVARRHLVWHLLIPLAVGALCESAVAAWLSETPFGAAEFRSYFFSLERLALLVGVVVTFSAVLYFNVQREAEVTRQTFGPVLEDALKSAETFFALAPTRLKEWFEPSTQLYFATIVKHQREYGAFHHVRTLLLFTPTDSVNLRAPLLDENYAKAFVNLHELSNAKLALIEREDIFSILQSELCLEDRKAIGCYKKWQTALLPDWVLTRIPIAWLRRRIRNLAVALVEYRDRVRGPRILVFSKRGPDLGIRVIEADNGVGLSFKKLLEAVRKEVMEPAGLPVSQQVVKPDHDLIAQFK